MATQPPSFDLCPKTFEAKRSWLLLEPNCAVETGHGGKLQSLAPRHLSRHYAGTRVDTAGSVNEPRGQCSQGCDLPGGSGLGEGKAGGNRRANPERALFPRSCELMTELRSWIEANDVPWVDVIAALDNDRSVVRTWVHPDATGNRMIAEAFSEQILRRVCAD